MISIESESNNSITNLGDNVSNVDNCTGISAHHFKPSLTGECCLSALESDCQMELTTDSDAGANPDDLEDINSESEAENEEWEDELTTTLMSCTDICDWGTLCDQIKDDLKKHKTLPLSQVNQLMILSHFATLRLKGSSCITASMEIARLWYDGKGMGAWFSRCVRALARHYQVFEQLPKEKRGSSRNSPSFLDDESVQTHCRTWLSSLPSGQVTPRTFWNALESTIFPELGITPKHLISERTASWWLIKLGWQHMAVCKGVYMDGHKHEDVVKYRREVYLPKMLEFECRMVCFEGKELTQVEPSPLVPTCQLKAYYHDESCFHANDNTSNAWYARLYCFWEYYWVCCRLHQGEHILWKKGRGRIIHVSDFINEEDGWLISCDADGNIVKDAWKIIFPGANGDAWWTHDDLLNQVQFAIQIHEEINGPGIQALFIFDNSSAHATLPPDALRAFDMNKSNGGKQRKQHDTIIPQSNPDPSKCGLPQKMTNDGKPKGLKSVLEEQGFDLTGLHNKCSPICPFESQGCCMARLLSQHDDFHNQLSMLEQLIHDARHECLFLPKFHCKLNPIEMVCLLSLSCYYISYITFLYSIGDGANTAIDKQRNWILQQQRKLQSRSSMNALLKSSGDLSTVHTDSWVHTGWGSQEKQQNGLCGSRNSTARYLNEQWWWLRPCSTHSVYTKFGNLPPLGAYKVTSTPPKNWPPEKHCGNVRWFQIWPLFSSKLTHLANIKFDVFGCPQLYTLLNYIPSKGPYVLTTYTKCIWWGGASEVLCHILLLVWHPGRLLLRVLVLSGWFVTVVVYYYHLSIT